MRISRPACAASCCCATARATTRRGIWNGAFDRHPALIARCTGAADVMEAVKFAAANQLLVSVRGGGHSLSGQSVCEKGLMIDLSQMNGVRVDPCEAHRDRRRRCVVRRARSRGAGAGTRHHGRHGFAHRRRRPHARRRIRPSRPALRPDLRQRARRRSRHRGRQVPHARATSRTRTCSGVCAAAAATSASRPRSSSSCIPIDPVMLGGDLVYSWEDAPAVLKFFFE